MSELGILARRGAMRGGAMRSGGGLVWLAVSAHCLPLLDPPFGLSVDEWDDAMRRSYA